MAQDLGARPSFSAQCRSLSATAVSSSGRSGSIGLSAFSDATLGADNSVAVNRQLSLPSSRQEQSIFSQPSNILYAVKQRYCRQRLSNFSPSTLQRSQPAVALLFHS